MLVNPKAGPGMLEPTLAVTLRAKRTETERSIKDYEAKPSQARADLAHVSAPIAVFESGGDERTAAYRFDTHRNLEKGEMVAFVRTELAKGDALDTCQACRRIALARGLDAEDGALLRAISCRLMRMLLLQLRRGTVASSGKVRDVRVRKAVAWSIRQVLRRPLGFKPHHVEQIGETRVADHASACVGAA